VASVGFSEAGGEAGRKRRFCLGFRELWREGERRGRFRAVFDRGPHPIEPTRLGYGEGRPMALAAVAWVVSAKTSQTFCIR
jgi:hypothetical protein